MGRMDKTMCIVQEKMYRYIPLNYTAYHLQVALFSSAIYAMHSLLLKNCVSSRLRSSVQASSCHPKISILSALPFLSFLDGAFSSGAFCTVNRTFIPFFSLMSWNCLRTSPA